MQSESALPAFAFPGEPAPWLLWDPLHGLQPDRLQPHQCPEKRVQDRRCTSGYQPKSRGKISSEKYFGFHSGNFTEGVSALYSEASLGDKWSLICLRVGAPNCLSFMAFGLCWTLTEHSKEWIGVVGRSVARCCFWFGNISFKLETGCSCFPYFFSVSLFVCASWVITCLCQDFIISNKRYIIDALWHAQSLSMNSTRHMFLPDSFCFLSLLLSKSLLQALLWQCVNAQQALTPHPLESTAFSAFDAFRSVLLPFCNNTYVYTCRHWRDVSIRNTWKEQKELKREDCRSLSPPCVYHEVMINGFGDVGGTEIACIFNSGGPLNRQGQGNQQFWGWKDPWCHLMWPQGDAAIASLGITLG